MRGRTVRALVAATRALAPQRRACEPIVRPLIVRCRAPRQRLLACDLRASGRYCRLRALVPLQAECRLCSTHCPFRNLSCLVVVFPCLFMTVRARWVPRGGEQDSFLGSLLPAELSDGPPFSHHDNAVAHAE